MELLVSAAADPLQEAVDQVKLLVDTNLERTVAQTEWDACQDSQALQWQSNDPLLAITGGSACISFGTNDDGAAFSKIRVKIPEQQVGTTFGRLFGADFLTTSAFAEVTLEGGGASGAFPSGIFAGTSAGATTCIKTGTGAANRESCGDPSTGDFGNFQPYFYSEVSPGNPTSLCTSGNQSAPLSRAMADGVDHPLGIITGSAPRVNGARCPQVPGPALPNRVDSKAGYSNADITNGLIKGTNWDGVFTGRLTRSFTGGATVFGYDIDNKPLWTYILSDPGLHPTCQAARDADPATWATDYANIMDDLVFCIGVETGQLFGDDIGNTARLASVPRYAQAAALPANSCCYDIIDFEPVFIQGVWTNNGPQWTCDGEIVSVAGDYCKHEPGLNGSISIAAVGQQRIDSASAIVLKCEHLPEDVCQELTTGGGSTGIFSTLQLTR